MNLQDIKTWTISADHKARPKNPYSEYISVKSPLIGAFTKNTSFSDFEAFAKDHTYACDKTLAPGDYPAKDVELIDQYRHLHCDWTNGKPDHEIENVSYLYRKYLQLKQPEKEQPEPFVPKKRRIALKELIEQISKAPKPTKEYQRHWIKLTDLDENKPYMFELLANKKDWEVQF